MAVSGGRDGWTRTVLTALGVGIGVSLLLLAAAVPGALRAHDARTSARDDLRVGQAIPAAADTLLVATVDTTFRDRPVRGRMVRPEGPAAPVPPGLAALPRAGEAVVSPALARLLASPDGALFAPRLAGARVVGTIGPQGLAGPGELAFYRGSDSLTEERASRLTAFGEAPRGEGFGPILTLLVVVVFVVLLLPIAVFLAAAVRFGGERRDRRLAALRLVGADAAMTRRVAVGEATAAALLGVAAGGALFALGRQVVPLVTVWNISVYAADVRPGWPLVLLVALAVPLVATGAALVALRGVLVEPLGVTRRAGTGRRRLWWRLLAPAAGLALLWPLLADGYAGRTGGPVEYQVAAGAALLLAGAVFLLPWLVETAVRRLHGGPLAWQLAVRRLQADSGAPARLVGGLAVAVAGVIGLQMLFAAVQAQYTTPTGQDTTRASAQAWVSAADPAGARDRLLAVRGVTGGTATVQVQATTAEPVASAPAVEVRVGDCAALAEFAELPDCADGRVFAADGPPEVGPPVPDPGAGGQLRVGPDGLAWTLPARVPHVAARVDPAGRTRSRLLVTPAALDVRRLAPQAPLEVYLRTDPGDPDTIERVRNAVAGIDAHGNAWPFAETVEADRFGTVRRGLYAGAVVTLLLIGASMLVGMLEQLRERRRLLATLVAVGTRRSTLGWSVLHQAALPVALGLLLAVGFGLAFGAILLRMLAVPFSVSWTVVGVSAGLAAATALLVTAGSLPALFRLTRPAGLRTE
ncbi:hypothetical protein CIK06_10210 [Plantactinospora sp. KBS50]|nr:hypothetical protein CIK06_10210 [Plantactinospora sp. KBS50]